MTSIATLRTVVRDRGLGRTLGALALSVAQAWAPPGVMDAAAPLWTVACVLARQLRGAATA